MARGFSETSHRPVGPRSGPQRPFNQTELLAITTASQPSGDKSPRHMSALRLLLYHDRLSGRARPSFSIR
ncbi:hypothetical protein DM828_13705 [Pseudomonas umsongensis]|nr:hypothetical protein [Pseudomonas umsongensis]